MAKLDNTKEYRGNEENANAVKSTDGHGNVYNYKPKNKDTRETRRTIWDRYQVMKDDPLRREAERRWDLGDKMYRMWAPERDPEDWRADVILPDGFSAIQTHMQETIDLRPRPVLEGVEESDQKLETFNNSVFQHAMNITEFDEETYKARNCSAIRGDAFTIEEYRYETREVEWPSKVNENNEIEYETKEVVDFDDIYTRHVDNWSVFWDPVEDPKYANDQIYREVMSYEEFKAEYEGKPGFKNIDKVVAASGVSKNAGFFKKAEDVEDDDVELLHYYNKLRDLYAVLCNNVVIREGPLPSRHKQLPIDWWNFYWVPGQCYGLGIPQIIYSLVEERRSLRNMGLDRQKMHIAKMFLVNDLFDFDEEDLTPRPHGLIKVNTNGLPMNQAIQALEYGDMPVSAIRMDQELKEDQRRAHGMDELNQAIGTGATATEAAILDEATQKRINLINTLSNWRTLKRVGIKKWSNIQFYYKAPRIEAIAEDNKTREKKVYKTVKVNGKKFELKGDPKKGEDVELIEREIEGSSRVTLDATWNKYLNHNFDITVDAANNVIESRAIKQAKTTELVERITTNPLLMRHADGQKIFKRLLEVNNESTSSWMMGEGKTVEEMKALADNENMIMARMNETGQIFEFPGTPGATEEHTEEHLNFIQTQFFQQMPQPIKDVMKAHIMEEVGNNPNIDMEGLMGGGGGEQESEGGPIQGGGGNAVVPGQPGGPAIPNIQLPGGPVVGGDITNAGPPLA